MSGGPVAACEVVDVLDHPSVLAARLTISEMKPKPANHCPDEVQCHHGEPVGVHLSQHCNVQRETGKEVYTLAPMQGQRGSDWYHLPNQLAIHKNNNEAVPAYF